MDKSRTNGARVDRMAVMALLTALVLGVFGGPSMPGALVSAAGGSTFGVGQPGPTGPIFSGPHQFPFVCGTAQSGLGQPLVDNFDGVGTPVTDDEGNVIGYSKDCSVPMRVDYFYRATDGTFKPLPDRAVRPADVAQTTTSEGLTVDYIVSVERGTINRFIYGIAVLAPFDYTPHSPHLPRVWNDRLVFTFGTGGGDLGYRQHSMNINEVLVDEFLSQGYAVAYTTGARTARSYNMTLAEESVMMVKDHFIARYGQPLYTVGIGSSGGALTQYVFAQNHPGLLDALIPIRAYPDMITQSIYVGDCELLEYYFDHSDDPRWQSKEAREVFEGLAGNDAMGETACVAGWRNSVQGLINPHMPTFDVSSVPPEVVAATRWSHWDDLRNMYGVDEYGFARNTWDNVGVQYGLASLQSGAISKDDFFDVNEKIGGWKRPHEFGPPTFPYDEGNINFGEPGNPNRTTGDVIGMQRAYQTGQVFRGYGDVPIIDLRQYEDPILDMHHFLQSFSARDRMINARGHADDQLIWVAGTKRVSGAFMSMHPDVLNLTMTTLDEWMANRRARPESTAAETRPAHAVDRCWHDDFTVLAEGPDVWAAGGPCREAYPPYETSRTLAGGPVAGDVFKCALMTVDEAVAWGLYPTEGPNAFTAEDIERLKAIFPDGVCDYSQPDVGFPANWFD